MNNALGNAFVIEVLRLFKVKVVFCERWSSLTSFERVLVIVNDDATLGTHGGMGATGDLVQLATITQFLANAIGLLDSYGGGVGHFVCMGLQHE